MAISFIFRIIAMILFLIALVPWPWPGNAMAGGLFCMALADVLEKSGK